jgi:hypothetical protein
MIKRVMIVFGFCYIVPALAGNGADMALQYIATTEAKAAEYAKYTELMLSGDFEAAETALKKMKRSDAKIKFSRALDPVKETRAWGIASACVGTYMKTRTYVRLVYDEMKFWGSLVQQYDDVKTFVDNMGNAFKDVYYSAKNLGKGGHGLLYTLDQIVDLNDDINSVKRMPKTLDYKIATMERTYDTGVTLHKKFTYSIGGGMLSATVSVPDGGIDLSSKHVMEYIDNAIHNDHKELYITVENKGDITTANLNPNKNDVFRRFTAPVESNKIAISDAMAASMAYRQWGQAALERMGDVDQKTELIAKTGGINGVEFAAVWYALENVNAMNKKISHSLWEAQVLVAMLSTEVHKTSTAREEQFRVLLTGHNGTADDDDDLDWWQPYYTK